jgi:hypothetical protein
LTTIVQPELGVGEAAGVAVELGVAVGVGVGAEATAGVGGTVEATRVAGVGVGVRPTNGVGGTAEPTRPVAVAVGVGADATAGVGGTVEATRVIGVGAEATTEAGDAVKIGPLALRSPFCATDARGPPGPVGVGVPSGEPEVIAAASVGVPLACTTRTQVAPTGMEKATVMRTTVTSRTARASGPPWAARRGRGAAPPGPFIPLRLSGVVIRLFLLSDLAHTWRHTDRGPGAGDRPQ